MHAYITVSLNSFVNVEKTRQKRGGQFKFFFFFFLHSHHLIAFYDDPNVALPLPHFLIIPTSIFIVHILSYNAILLFTAQQQLTKKNYKKISSLPPRLSSQIRPLVAQRADPTTVHVVLPTKTSFTNPSAPYFGPKARCPPSSFVLVCFDTCAPTRQIVALARLLGHQGKAQGADHPHHNHPAHQAPTIGHQH